MMGKDAKIDMARWRQFNTLGNSLVAWTSISFFVFLIPVWIGEGYFKNFDQAALFGLAEVFWFSFGCSLVTGLGVLTAFLTYEHPNVDVSCASGVEGIVPDTLLTDGERVVRGARLTLGPSAKHLEKAAKDSVEAGQRLGMKNPLPTIAVASSPFPYRFENMGCFIIGSAGSGKSQLIKQMIYDIRARGGRDKLVIYDRKPEYMPLFYRQNDVVICPADKRHTPWDIFAEIKGEQDLDGIIRSLMPDMPGTNANDKFWVESARNVFKGILIYLLNSTDKPSNIDLCKLLFNSASMPKDLWDKLKQYDSTRTYATSLADAENPRSTVPGSVLSTLKSYTDSFTRAEIAEKGWFSIKKWLHDPNTEGQAVFLANPARYESNYKSYFTCILDLGLREMISLPADLDRRIWFFIDEFGSLHKLDSVVRLLAEGRSKGACVVLGTQDLAQVKQAYKDEVETLVNNCNSKVIARVTSKDEAKYFSELVGDMEVEKGEGSMSTNLNDDRGFSMSVNDQSTRRRERRSVVLPAEIMNLTNLTYFAKFCEFDWFRNAIEYYPWDSHIVVPEFLERSTAYFDTRRLIN
jgi:hypothetical protein